MGTGKGIVLGHRKQWFEGYLNKKFVTGVRSNPALPVEGPKQPKVSVSFFATQKVVSLELEIPPQIAPPLNFEDFRPVRNSGRAEINPPPYFRKFLGETRDKH